MEVQFAPEIEKQLIDLAAQSGLAASELVQNAVAGYVGEVGEMRVMLNSRYDEIKSGKVQLMDGEEAFAGLHERIKARRNSP